jgi:peroxiredoxin
MQQPGHTLAAGQTAPSFALPDADMQTVSLSAFKGKKHVILYFYPSSPPTFPTTRSSSSSTTA